MKPCASSQSRGSWPKLCQVQCRPVGEARAPPHRVNAADKAPQLLAYRPILEFGGAAATVRVDGKTKTGEGRERADALEGEWLDRGNLFPGKLAHEAVLLEDLRVGPAPRAIELGHARRSVGEGNLVDAVFVAVEREQATVAFEPDAVECVEHDVRRQAGKRRGQGARSQYSTGIGSRLRQRYQVATERHGRQGSASAIIAARSRRSPPL